MSEQKVDQATPKDKLILIVDDDEGIVELLKHVLEREGFRTDAAYDGILALKKVQASLPHLIVLDLMLPGYAGYELLKKFQEDWETRNIPVVIITAKTVDESTRQMFISESNVKDFIEKPISPEGIVMKIHKILNTKSRADAVLEKYREDIPEDLKKFFKGEK